jgi:hypothetical protein
VSAAVAHVHCRLSVAGAVANAAGSTTEDLKRQKKLVGRRNSPVWTNQLNPGYQVDCHFMAMEVFTFPSSTATLLL